MDWKLVGAAVSLTVVAACATKAVSVSDATDVPPARIYASEYTDPAPGKVAVNVLRDSGFVGGGCISAVYLDGRKVAAIDKAERLPLHLKPGRYVLGSGPNPDGVGLCKAGADRARRETEITVEAGVPMNYRISLSGNGELSITRTAF